jgi:hypothetical protein
MSRSRKAGAWRQRLESGRRRGQRRPSSTTSRSRTTTRRHAGARLQGASRTRARRHRPCCTWRGLSGSRAAPRSRCSSSTTSMSATRRASLRRWSASNDIAPSGRPRSVARARSPGTAAPSSRPTVARLEFISAGRRGTGTGQRRDRPEQHKRTNASVRKGTPVGSRPTQKSVRCQLPAEAGSVEEEHWRLSCCESSRGVSGGIGVNRNRKVHQDQEAKSAPFGLSVAVQAEGRRAVA